MTIACGVFPSLITYFLTPSPVLGVGALFKRGGLGGNFTKDIPYRKLPDMDVRKSYTLRLWREATVLRKSC